MSITEYDFNLTRNEIIQRAFRITGALKLRQSLTADQFTQGNIALNCMIKLWQADNIFLWTLREMTQAITSASASYSLASVDPTVMWIDKAWYRDSSNTDIPLEIITWRGYEGIEDKLVTGSPVKIAIDSRIAPTMYVYPKPDANYTVYYLAVAKLKDFDSASQNPDLMTMWLNAIAYGLAFDLADEHGCPLSERQHVGGKFTSFYKAAKRGSSEKSDNTFVRGAFR